MGRLSEIRQYGDLDACSRRAARGYCQARVPTGFHGRLDRFGQDGFVVVDQIRAVDVERFAKRLGRLTPATLNRSLEVLQAMFAA